VHLKLWRWEAESWTCGLGYWPESERRENEFEVFKNLSDDKEGMHLIGWQYG
jgi:hypothetical protein